MTSLSGTPETTATSSEGVAARIRAFLIDTFLLGEDDGFADDESLLEQGIVDSTGVMELVAFLEDTFAVVIADDELVAANLDSVTRMAAFVERKGGSALSSDVRPVHGESDSSLARTDDAARATPFEEEDAASGESGRRGGSADVAGQGTR